MIIGIIGPQISCEKIKDDIAIIFPDIQVKLYIREAAYEAIQVIGQCEDECDATLFTGCGLYFSAIQQFGYVTKKPCDYINKCSTSLITTFLEMQKKGFEINHFSIDVAEPATIQDTFAEISINPDNFYSLPFDSCNEQDYINWHLDLWNKGKIKVMLTGFAYVYNYLKQQGYPIFYLSPSRSMIRAAVERLKSSVALKQANYSQITVEIFRLNEKSVEGENYYSNMIKKGEAENYIIHYAQKIQGSFFRLGPREYVIFASKGFVENEDNYTLIYQLQSAIDKKGFTTNAGIGIGSSAYKAESNARKALKNSMSSKDNSLFLINDSNVVIGPLGKEKNLEYQIISSDSKVMEIAQKTEMSPSSITKLMSVIKMRNSSVFDAQQLADCLHISSRSARRIMNKLMECEYACVCAKEGNLGGGRPKSIIDIHF